MFPLHFLQFLKAHTRIDYKGRILTGSKLHRSILINKINSNHSHACNLARIYHSLYFTARRGHIRSLWSQSPFDSRQFINLIDSGTARLQGVKRLYEPPQIRRSNVSGLLTCTLSKHTFTILSKHVERGADLSVTIRRRRSNDYS